MADTLFSDPSDRSRQPLAERLRPRNIDEVIGQQHLLGSGKPLRVAFESGEPQRLAGPDQVRLADDLVERLRPQTFG